MSDQFSNHIKEINKINVPKDKVYDAIKNGIDKAVKINIIRKEKGRVIR